MDPRAAYPVKAELAPGHSVDPLGFTFVCVLTDITKVSAGHQLGRLFVGGEVLIGAGGEADLVVCVCELSGS